MKKILLSTLTAAAITAAAIVPASAACAPDRTQTRPVCYEWSWSCEISRPETGCGWIVRPGSGCESWNGCPDAGEKPEFTPSPEQPEEDAPAPELPPETDPTPDETPDAEESETGSVSSFERRVAELVNEQRAAYGLPALTLDPQLCDGARMKSRDMASNGYFSHNSPTYGTPFEMMRSLGITYRTAGENIAKGYSTPEAVMNGWMNSEGHRANILSADYTKIGVGYVADGSYWTQWFIS